MKWDMFKLDLCDIFNVELCKKEFIVGEKKKL